MVRCTTIISSERFADTSRSILYLQVNTRKKIKMSVYKIAFAFTLICALSNAQRPFYAGLRPIGYPETESNVLLNRFGEDTDLPIEAKGDGNLINRLNQMPIDNRPFWYLNSRQYDELRKNPQTFQLRPNGFVDRNTVR